jgi:hypothetical protein
MTTTGASGSETESEALGSWLFGEGRGGYYSFQGVDSSQTFVLGGLKKYERGC